MRAHAEGTAASRRAVVLAPSVAAIATAALQMAAPSPAVAETELLTFMGMDRPPTSYGGYGGNDPNELPKYTFQYPQGWNSIVPNKVEKGTQGIDCRIVDPKNKAHRIFVITLGRAGEDYATFQLRDVDSTFQGFVGADYELQDAMTDAVNIERGEREEGGRRYFDYRVEAPDVQYDASITTARGRVYALFVRTPLRDLKADPGLPKRITQSFRTL